MDILLFYQIAVTAFFGIFGLVIGSFLNVCIYRIPEGRTIVKGHSMCMSCGHELGVLDLVPLLSWLFLRRTCRYCSSPISSRYAIIEGLTGIVYALLAWHNRETFFLPGASAGNLTGFTGNLTGFMSLLLLMMLAAVMIVSMMIQKDQKTGMYRLSLSILVLFILRILLCFLDISSLLPVLVSSAQGFLVSAGILLAVIIFSPSAWRSPRVFFSDIITGKTVRVYFASSGRANRTADVFFVAVSSAIGFSAAVPCFFAYAAVRAARNQDTLLPYSGIVIAASALIGVMFFPGGIF